MLSMALLTWARAPPDGACAYWAVLLAAALVPADSFAQGKAYWPLGRLFVISVKCCT